MEKEIEQLYKDERRNKVMFMSRVMGGDYHAGEDIVQEAFCNAWKYRDSFDPDRATLKTWFNGILFNALRAYQRQKRNDPVRKAKEISAEDVLIEGRPTHEILKRHIKKVPNELHQRVLELFFLFGYSSREISEVVEGMSLSNVGTVVYRFKKEYEEGSNLT